MKKIILFFSLLIVLIGCTKTNPYTDEFTYLPRHPEMELVEIVEQSEESEFRSVTYIIKDSDIETVMEEYQVFLHEDSWIITSDNKPTSLEAAKDEHVVNIFAYQKNTDVQLAVVTK